MSRAQIKQAISRIKRAADIDFKRQAYEEALERHRARLGTVTLAEFIRENKRALRVGGTVDDEEPLTKLEIQELERDLKAARAEDTREHWRKDQATIENYHLERFGHLKFAMRLKAFGTSHTEMWRHYMKLLGESVREVREGGGGPDANQRMPLQGNALRKKQYEKPVRLHPASNRPLPEFEAILGPQTLCYTPEFADGTKHPELAPDYPYYLYSEFDGHTILEFYDKNSD